MKGKDDAVADWDGKGNTEHLKQVGLNDNIHLQDGEYIPSVGELYFIFINKKEINEALRYCGGDEIVDKRYWSSTAVSAANAWCLNFGDGNLNNWNTKVSDKNQVRPVSAFYN